MGVNVPNAHPLCARDLLAASARLQ